MSACPYRAIPVNKKLLYIIYAALDQRRFCVCWDTTYIFNTVNQPIPKGYIKSSKLLGKHESPGLTLIYIGMRRRDIGLGMKVHTSKALKER